MLELRGVGRSFGHRVALQDLTFDIPRGQVVGFLGPNGAGKTTAMRIVMGILLPDQGEVRWQGAPLTRQARLRFGYMPEERGLYPGMRVGEQLVYLARLHGMAPAAAAPAVATWLERLGLAGQGDRKLEALSLGNQQRAQLAAALTHDPELLILDEPFSGLDPPGIEALSEVLAERAAVGVSVVFSSHQLDLVEHLCESVVIVSKGRLVAQGSVEALGRSGLRRYSVGVIGDPTARWAENVAGVRVVGIRGGIADLELGPDTDAQWLLDRARAAGGIEQFGVRHRRLSDVFRAALEEPDTTHVPPSGAHPDSDAGPST